MRGIRIDYGGFAVGAKENFVPSTADKESFVDLGELQQEGLAFPNYGNPCELYSVLLDGNTKPLPDDMGSANIGWWSEQISGENGEFAEPIVLTLTSSEFYYTSSGITLTFDTYNGIFANDIVIGWYQDDIIIGEEKAYTPDSAFYFCQNKVENYNKVVITFNSINMPYNRLKLRSIDYGMKITFYGDELRNAKIIQEIDPLSSQIAINTCDFTLDSKRNIEYSFQERQPVAVYFNNILQSTSFIKSFTRKSKNVWNIQAEDYIGLMENTVFYGGIYSNKNAVDLLEEIFIKANVPYSISDLSNEAVTGYIPYTSCREALMQVVFAVGAVVDTSNSNSINVYKLNDEITQTIPLERIMQGQNFDEETKVTAVEVTAHKYIPTNEIVMVYDATESGTGQNIFVKFSEPLHDLSITNGTISQSHTNYAVINASANCTLTGQKYEHTQTVSTIKNPILTDTDIENVVSVQNATLVSSGNIDNVLAKCYNYYVNNNIINLKIVEGKHEKKNDKVKYGQAIYGTFKYGDTSNTTIIYDEPTKVGEYIECETEYLGNIKGTIIKQTYNLNGGILIKDTQMKRGE